MFLFETILFYKSVPSYYKVYLLEEGYFFEAVALEYYKEINFPNFLLSGKDKNYLVSGTDIDELIQQATEDLQKFAYLQKNAEVV